MLPTTRLGGGYSNGPSDHALLGCFTRRRIIIALASVTQCHASHHVPRGHTPGTPAKTVAGENATLPPLYTGYHRDLMRLPQHHWERTTPAPHERFFFVAGHAAGTGWGNGMEEFVMNGYMAYKAGRSFVFGNYTWNSDGPLYSEYHGHLIPSLIPYSAITRGYLTGDPLPAGDHAPLAVSRHYYEQLCPDPVIISREEVHDHLVHPLNAKEVTDAWVAKLNSVDDPCVQSAKNSGQLYDYMVLGDPDAMHDIWPEFSTSPIITHWRWSPLIELAYDMNRELFQPSDTTVEPFYAANTALTNKARYPQIHGLLALHVRRGDFVEHCDNLRNWASTFLGFNSMHDMLDRFEPRPPGEPDLNAVYMPRCWPTVEQIVKKVHQVRQTPAGKGLKRVHIMSNGRPEYLAELKQALWKEGGWEAVVTSREMLLNWEQKHVSMAVDMLIGQRAQVFIGNGFSTLTSNVVMMRKANGFSAGSSRLW
ncbi:uncharacterized protein BXZ73DRAFT_106934 [Epithele typhae]|uniref:uncharacterized protein n=1 Tax=Epithele typhae TaxID=378194 RepID=UPI002007BC57|nr:uncharacterized protein BXZ73DRAFT_106934 [Epithele typhae]KAH9913459.1 hypothetical protein BXZ73DRAFT_106934 [Epithele typhae]